MNELNKLNCLLLASLSNLVQYNSLVYSANVKVTKKMKHLNTALRTVFTTLHFFGNS
jgi:hypothetical protein